MGRRLTVVLVAILVIAPASHATCRHCDVPAESRCHAGSGAPDDGSADGGSRPSECTCAAGHLVCVDSPRATMTPPAASPLSGLAMPGMRTTECIAGSADIGRVAAMRGSPPRPRVPRHLALRVLLV